MHQVASVQMRNYFHAWRQEMIVEEIHLLVQSFKHIIGIRAFAQQHESGHHVGIVHDPFGPVMNCFADLAQSDFGSLLNHSDFAHSQRPCPRLFGQPMRAAC